MSTEKQCQICKLPTRECLEHWWIRPGTFSDPPGGKMWGSKNAHLPFPDVRSKEAILRASTEE